ncbi:MAG: glycosyltransferase family 2 protein [Desulfobaccales bacterium]
MGVSIIIPSYNSEKYLAVTIQSVLAQTRQDWELMVVNDGSADQTGAIAETFAAKDDRIRVVHQANAGLPMARNRGFAETGTDYEYCIFLDSDDLLEPDALEILIHALDKDRAAVAAHGLMRYIDSEGRPLSINGRYFHPPQRRGIQGHRLKLWPVSAPTTFAVLAYGNCIPASGIMMRRAQQEIAGGFDPNLKAVEDWDMWLRLSRLGHIAFVDKVVLAYRIHQTNMSRNGQLMTESEYCVRKKMYRSADLDGYEKSRILIGYRYHKLSKARDHFSLATRKLSRGRCIAAIKHLQVAMRHILSSFKGDL